jgi:hypothetical protein
VLALALGGLAVTAGAASEAAHEFSLAGVCHRNPEIATMQGGSNGAPAVLLFTPRRESDALELWQASEPLDWSAGDYLVCEVWHTNAASAIVYLELQRKGDLREESIVQQGGQTSEIAHSPRISFKVGVLPGLRTQVVFPLSSLDGQAVFLPRFPRQLSATVMGSRMEAAEIGSLRLRLAPVRPPECPGSLCIARLYLTKGRPAPLPAEERPYVDKFGQWARKEWAGKISDEAVLRQELQRLEEQARAGAYPTNWSRYGGWLAKRFKATGFFRTEHDGRRWWLVDPDGFAFLSAGMDCVEANVATTTQGQEDLFAWLPERKGRFAKAYSRGGVDFLRANLIRVYGENWEPAWERLTASLLKAGGFNTVANWSDIGFAQRARLPYVLPMRGFPKTTVKLYRDFPDVCGREYVVAARQFANQLKPYKDDPFLVGYFLSNEPHWAFGKNNLAFEIFATTQESVTKKEFIRWIRKRYDNDLKHFNRAWGLSLSSFAGLAKKTFREMPSDTAEKDFWEFSGIMAERYVAVPCDAVKAVDPHHLNLGMRYAWISSDLLYRAGQRFDVFSINGYNFPGPPDTAEIARRSNKPVMIGEFHFGATDRGLPATGIQGTARQAERAKAYRYYVEQGFSRPEIVGLHYFQWFDQAIAGRFDGENFNIGFMDICHQPYPELMQSARQTHERLYSVAAGETAPFAEKPQWAPQIFY